MMLTMVMVIMVRIWLWWRRVPMEDDVEHGQTILLWGASQALKAAHGEIPRLQVLIYILKRVLLVLIFHACGIIYHFLCSINTIVIKNTRYRPRPKRTCIVDGKCFLISIYNQTSFKKRAPYQSESSHTAVLVFFLSAMLILVLR